MDNCRMLSPTTLMDLVSGFWSFKTLAAAVNLDLFTALRDGRVVTVAEVCAEFDTAERPTDMLLAACTSLGLLERAADGYRNSELAEEFLVKGRPNYFGGQVRYCDERTYLAWHRIEEALRTDKPLTWDLDQGGSFFEIANHQTRELFWDAMHSTSMFTAGALGDAYHFGAHRSLLDVGGGSGAYAIVLSQRNPALRATVFDLPHVCEIAGRNIAKAGLDDRVRTHPGDFLSASTLPSGHDVILLSMVLHDWDEATNRALLAKCHQALPSGGVVIISELILNPDRDGPVAAALMGLNMVVETQGGRNYSETEYAEWLMDAGFTDVRRLVFDAPGANGAMVATRP
jgi:3-hydroxy-5-methyl-1-naphthoate 3-O-methyltransferase